MQTPGSPGAADAAASLSSAELLFFDALPAMLPLYLALRGQVLSRCPGTEIRVARTQITFRSRYGYAFVSLPWRRVKGRPAQYLLLSFGLPCRKQSPRIEQAVEPYPRRWTHHVILTGPEQLDDELLGWIEEACAFARTK